MKALNLIVILLLSAFSGLAQTFDFFNDDDFVKYRNHWNAAIGASNFLGDLGGKNGIGTNDLRDLEVTQFNVAAMVGYRHAFIKHLYGRADFSYGRVSGNDNLTKEPFRNNRNLSFRSEIFEFDLTLEGWIRLGGKKGHQYKIERVGKEKSPWRVRGSYLTLFAGIGGFHFNPKTQFQGQWIDLRPLRTEGQGLPGGPKEYKLYQLNIPVGMSLMFRIHKQWSVGLEATYRYTFTDYIDDVSSAYYNPSDIALYTQNGLGDIAAYLSDPSIGAANGGLGNNVTAPGQQRGDKTDNDGYLYLMVKVDYWVTDHVKKHNAGVHRKGFKTHRLR